MARSLARFDPLLGLDTLRREWFGEGLFPFLGTRVPPTDVYTEGDDTLVVEAHLPNFSAEDVEVSVDRGSLVIRADKHEKSEEKNKNYVTRESSTSFYRSVTLPDSADEEKVSAEFEHGVLKVRVPLSPADTPRTVAIETPGHADSAGGGKAQQSAPGEASGAESGAASAPESVPAPGSDRT